MGLEFEGIDVYLNLAVSAPVRLRHRRALHVGYLVAHLKLRDVFELRFVKALAFQRNQANRLARGIHSQHNRWQRAWRQAAQVGHSKVGDVAERGIRVGSRFEIDFDQADAGQRARLGVIDIRPESEKTLKRICDIRLDLLRRHAAVEGRNHHHRNIDLGKKIDRHAEHIEDADQHDHQAQHDDEIGIFEGKLGHYCSPP